MVRTENDSTTSYAEHRMQAWKQSPSPKGQVGNEVIMGDGRARDL